MIRKDEIRPLARQQQLLNHDYCYGDLLTYDVNNDKTIQRSSLINHFVGAMSGRPANQSNSTKENANVARMYNLASPNTRNLF